jgi:hypothetical protein
MLNEHERLLIENFVKKDKQERLRFLLSEPSRRKRLRAKFSSTFVFLEEKCRAIPSSDQNPADIYQLLQNSGAPERCYTISEDDDLDGQNANLREMLDRLVGAGIETIVCCVPGRLAYFEGEQERFILSQPPSKPPT